MACEYFSVLYGAISRGYAPLPRTSLLRLRGREWMPNPRDGFWLEAAPHFLRLGRAGAFSLSL